MSVVYISVAVAFCAFLVWATWRAPRLSSAIFWAAVATILCSAVLLLAAPGELAGKAIWLGLTVPLIWVGFQFWAYWDAKGWRVALGLVGLSFASGAYIYLAA